ncbi:MAG: ABC transporter ATP-binding protein [Saprospiraceae bacterium]|nr:ABC transporter ATP-binding protein [Saprospiraceae bacterium]
MIHLKKLLPYFYKYKWKFWFGILCVALSNYFKILQPQIVRQSIDYVINSVSKNKLTGNVQNFDAQILINFGLTIVGLSLLMGLFMYFMRQTIIVMSRWMEYDLRNDIFAHYSNLDISFFKKNTVGDILSRITEDVSKVRMAIGPAILYCINLLTLFIFAIFSMLHINRELTFYTLLPLPILSISIYYVSKLINKKSEEIQKQLAVVTTITQESYSGIRIMKSFVMEKMISSLFEESTEKYRKDALKLAKVNSVFSPLILLLIGLSTILTIYIGGVKVMSGEITYGNVAEFVIYINMLTWPVTSLGWIASLVQQAAASQKRINEFLDTKSIIIDNESKNVAFSGNIAFKSVTFTYPETKVTALEKINFTIQQGQKIAIIGKTGSGKSTIAELLLRTYDVEIGEIYLDGKNLKNYSLSNIRTNIAYVPQDVFLFSDTIYNNIALNNKQVTLEMVEEITRKVSLWEDIQQMPEKFSTIIGERGVTLSGGQKQRIAIARALIKKPDIIILDDCLSAVDTETEYNILQFLKTSLGSITSIFITHRLFQSMKFDQIITLEDGKIQKIEFPN